MKLNPDKKTRLIDAKPATLHPLPLEIAAKQHPIKQPTLNVSSLVISKRHARPTLKNGKSSHQLLNYSSNKISCLVESLRDTRIYSH